MPYYESAEELPEVGRELRQTRAFGLPGPSLFDELTEQLVEGELLMGLYDASMYKIAPHLFSEEELGVWDAEQKRGAYSRYRFFALPLSVAQEKGLA